MNIKQRRLVSPVTVRGLDFFGFESSIAFFPSKQSGWYLRTDTGLVPIDHRIATYKNGRIQIRHGAKSIEIWEHISALRFWGIDYVEVDARSPWVPYLTAGGYLDQFPDGALKETGGYIPIVQAQEGRFDSYNRLMSSVSVEPNKELVLTVSSEWKGLPRFDGIVKENTPPIFHRWSCISGAVQNFSFSEKFLKEVFSAKPQALPSRRLLAFLLEKIYKWPHRKNVSWQKDFSDKHEGARQWWLHRVQDLLGELGLVHHQKLPTGNVFSFMAGHKESLACFKEAFPL